MRLNAVCLKLVRWTAWPLLAVVVGFVLTGYSIRGRYGLGKLMDGQTALTLHNAFHLPLLILLVAHCLPATYLSFQRWGWLGFGRKGRENERK